MNVRRFAFTVAGALVLGAATGAAQTASGAATQKPAGAAAAQKPAAPAATQKPGQKLTDAEATAILTKGGCTICHSVDKKIVGPSYMEVAKKHKGEKAAATTLADHIRKGSTGVYGPIPMPPNPPDKISDADMKALVDWILTKA